MTQIKSTFSAACLALACITACAHGSGGQPAAVSRAAVSGQVSAAAATAPGGIGVSYSAASADLSARAVSGELQVSASGLAWNQSTGRASGSASSVGSGLAAVSGAGVSVSGEAGLGLSATSNRGIAASATATGRASMTAATGDVRAALSVDALATKGLVTVDGAPLAAGSGTSTASAVAAVLAAPARNPHSED